MDAREILDRYLAIFSAADIERAMEGVAAPGFTYSINDMPPPQGETLLQRIAGLREAFPDYSSTVEEFAASGSTIAARCRGRGTHRGEFRFAGIVIPATGRSINYTGATFLHVSDGLVTRETTEANFQTLVQQLRG